MDKIISLCKRRGFIFPGSEIYGGLANSWDFGHLGISLANNIKKLWWKMFVEDRQDMVGIGTRIIMNTNVWKASGHITNFSDPLVECKECHGRFRADHVKDRCPECKAENFTPSRDFNLMFKTFIGSVAGEGAAVYLRPELAGGMFVNFKNILQATRRRLPFGIAQIGAAFRNEITTGNFLFRLREFEIMELEYFVHERDWGQYFDDWLLYMKKWMKCLGLRDSDLYFHELDKKDLAHYSKRTIDIEYKFPFGQSELYGLAYRTDHDLKAHMKASGQDLSYTDPETNEKFIPHVVEPTMGLERTFLAVLLSAFQEVEPRSGSKETQAKHAKEIILRLPYALAPVKAAVLPLMKKEPLVKKAREVVEHLVGVGPLEYDETGAIGRRYRRQDEIGTPHCVTIDYQTLEDNTVTVRDRDTMKQERVGLEELRSRLAIDKQLLIVNSKK